MIYSIYYPKYNVRQEKVLIPHKVWLTYKEMTYDTTEDIKAAKQYLKTYTKGREWFTDQSPLYRAIDTGILDCMIITECIVTKNK